MSGCSKEACGYAKEMGEVVCALAKLEFLEQLAGEAASSMVQVGLTDGVVLLELKGVVDFAAEYERLSKNLAQLDKNLQGYAEKLGNAAFVERAPQKVVEEEKKRQEEALAARAKVEAALARLKNLV